MPIRIDKLIAVIFSLVLLSGCVVVTTAVGVTTTVVGGAIEVVDIVTPDIFDDESDEDQDKENNP